MTVYADNMDRLAFPDVDETFDALGLETRRGRIHRLDDAPLAHVRDEIMLGASASNRGRSAWDSAP